MVLLQKIIFRITGVERAVLTFPHFSFHNDIKDFFLILRFDIL